MRPKEGTTHRSKPAQRRIDVDKLIEFSEGLLGEPTEITSKRFDPYELPCPLRSEAICSSGTDTKIRLLVAFVQ